MEKNICLSIKNCFVSFLSVIISNFDTVMASELFDTNAIYWSKFATGIQKKKKTIDEIKREGKKKKL